MPGRLDSSSLSPYKVADGPGTFAAGALADQDVGNTSISSGQKSGLSILLLFESSDRSIQTIVGAESIAAQSDPQENGTKYEVFTKLYNTTSTLLTYLESEGIFFGSQNDGVHLKLIPPISNLITDSVGSKYSPSILPVHFQLFTQDDASNLTKCLIYATYENSNPNNCMFSYQNQR